MPGLSKGVIVAMPRTIRVAREAGDGGAMTDLTRPTAAESRPGCEAATYPLSASTVPRHRVDQRGLARLDLCDRPLERRLEIVGVVDRAFGPPARRAGEAGEVWRRSKQIRADMGAADIRAAGARHDDLMVPVVVIGAVVVHDDEQRDLVFRGDPQRAGVVHQVAVGLQIDDQPAGALMGERNTERSADLRSGAELAPGVAVRAIEVPQLARPLVQCPGGEHP